MADLPGTDQERYLWYFSALSGMAGNREKRLVKIPYTVPGDLFISPLIWIREVWNENH